MSDLYNGMDAMKRSIRNKARKREKVDRLQRLAAFVLCMALFANTIPRESWPPRAMRLRRPMYFYWRKIRRIQRLPSGTPPTGFLTEKQTAKSWILAVRP